MQRFYNFLVKNQNIRYSTQMCEIVILYIILRGLIFANADIEKFRVD